MSRLNFSTNAPPPVASRTYARFNARAAVARPRYQIPWTMIATALIVMSVVFFVVWTA